MVVLLVVAVGALYAILPGLIEGPEVRQRIQEGAREATGRDFDYETLAIGIFPPRLRLVGPTLAGEAEGDPPFAEAREVSLRIALLPLLGRAIVLESFRIESPTVRLVRDSTGLRLPEREEPEREAPREPRPEKSEPASDDSGLAFAVKRASLRDGKLVFEDRTVSPAATIEVTSLDVTAALSSTDPTEVELDADVARGSLAVKGRADLLAQQSEWTAKLDGIDVAVAAPYLGKGQTAAGRLSGTVSGKGEPTSPAITADLALADGDVRISDVGLRGSLTVRADLSGGDAPTGDFEVDATSASLDAFDGAYRKPAGKPGSVKGKFLQRANGGITVDDLELKIHNLEARGKVEVRDERIDAELTADPVDLAGWDELVPALAEYELGGVVRPGTLRVTTEPLSVRGRIGLEAVRLVLPEEGGAKGPQLTLQGAVEGTGDALKLVDVLLTTGGQSVTVGGEVSGLSQERMGYRLALDADGPETNTLLTAFAGMDDQIYGPLFLDTDLRGRTGDPNLETLTGRAQFAVRPGKIEDVSILQLTVERLGTFGEAALLVAGFDDPAKAKKLERFYGDEFQELAATFDVSGGWARTRDFRLIYPSYRVDLVGGIRLSDLGLDMTGTLTMDREVDEALADASGAPQEAQKRTIELAKVQGTLVEPEIKLSSSAVRGWVGSYAGRKVRDKYQEKIDEKLGGELGGEVGKALEGFLGGRKR